MLRQINLSQRAGWAVLALLAALIVAPAALAQKEVFVRSKPHVNVGTIGDAESPPGNFVGQAAEVVCPEPSVPLPPGTSLPEECLPPRQAVGGGSLSPPLGNR